MSQNAFLLQNNPPRAEADVERSCFHCGLPVTKANRVEAAVGGEIHSFCCTGCSTVCSTIYDSGLESYYDKIRENFETPSRPAQRPKYIEQYDLEDVQKEFVREKNGAKEADFIVEGMHCASCAWLIEKALQDVPGVELAEVNLSRQRLRMRWDQKKSSLSNLISGLSSFGYSALPYNPETAEGQIKRFNRKLLYKMAFAGFGAMNMMWISIALYAGAFSGMDAPLREFFHYVSFTIATPVLLFSGWSITSLAFRGLLQRKLTMDLPIAIGAWVSYLYSVWQTFWGKGHVYFDTVVTFLFVILIGRYLEALAKSKASSEGFRLNKLQPKTAARITENGEERISVKRLNKGDTILIRPGDRIPADGIIEEGESSVDESMLSGESKPVFKTKGERVEAGTSNLDGSLTVKIETAGEGTMLSKIISLVEAAQMSKAKIQQFADRIVPWFVSVTLTLALFTFLYWRQTDLDVALMAAVSVLIITCPCALGLATPMSIVVASGLGAGLGFLVRDGKAMERLAGITLVVFDKTGTLTTGEISVSRFVAKNPKEKNSLLKTAASIENQFNHPIASAIVAYFQKQTPGALVSVKNARAFPGLGVSGTVKGKKIYLGNRKFLESHHIEIPPGQYEEGEDSMSAVYMAEETRYAGVFYNQDTIRENAAELINELKEQNIELKIMTGDSSSAAVFLQNKLGPVPIQSDMLPQEKASEIEKLKSQGEKVLMIGDGINDAPALALADVGISMGSGTEVAIESSDVVLIGDDLMKVLAALRLGKAAIRTIYQNIFLSLVYNVFLIPVAMAALVTPVFAAVAMPVSSLAVITNALLIRHRMKKGSKWM